MSEQQKPPKAPKHYAVLSSPRRGTYSCPTCGYLGDISAAIAHSSKSQFDLTQQEPSRG